MLMLRVGLVLFVCSPVCAEPTESQSLFDGKSLGNWTSTNFGGEGEVYVEDGHLVLEMGSDLTGVTWTKPKELLPIDYEIVVEARKTAGNDFFCGLTFPVEKDFCSLIVGGWGGGLVGISSLDGRDASDNETSSWHQFKPDQWYRIRLWVMRGRIQAWIDDKRIVNADTEGRRITTRGEVHLSEPLGLSTYRTTAEYRLIELRPLTKDEVKTALSEVDDD